MQRVHERPWSPPTRRLAWLASAALLLAAAPAAHAQQGVVQGQVTDRGTGEPIAAAAVQVLNTDLSVVTDDEGRYRIAGVPAGSHTVVITFLGYASARQAVAVGAGETMTADFALEHSAIALDAVIVTGAAGGARLRTIGHSVATVDAAEVMALSPAPTFTSLLAARAPGLRIAQTSGRLGASPEINIRGSSGALIYIDGVRVNSQTGLGAVGGNLGAQGSFIAGRLNDIDPEDIESIEVIKGPAAATIYGTEAMNGVVQIITKKGAVNQAPQFNIRAQYGSIFFRDAVNRMPTNYMRDESGEVVAWNAIRQEEERGTPLFTRGHSTGLYGSVSGGTDIVRYYASASWDEEEGIEPNNYGNQFALHSNLDVAISPKLNISTSINFSELDNHLGSEDAVSAMLGATCGHILLHPDRRGFCLGYPPEVSWELYDNMADVSRFTTSGTINYAMTDWLRHRLLIGVDRTSGDHRFLERFAPPELARYLTPSQAEGRIGQTLRLNRNVTVDYSGSANADVTGSLRSYLSAGLQVMRVESTTSNLGGLGFPAPGIEAITSTATKLNSTQTDVLNTTVGGYVQEKLGWNDRLFVTAAVRVDNNSAFGEDLQWVFYPKADVAWVISEESFWKWGDVVDMLRVRAAYGESGQAPSTFAALRTFTPIQGPNGTNAVTPGAQGNPNLKPERGKEWEAGFESVLFDGRLSFDFTYFNKKQVDLIQNEGVAPSSGFPGSIPLNIGRVDVSGFEMRADFQALRRDNFEWSIDANVAADESYVVDMGDLTGDQTEAGEGIRADYPTGAVFTRRVVSAELDPTTGNAINVLCDGGPDNDHALMACADAPTLYIGQVRPKYSGAIGNTFTIGENLRLYALVDFQSEHLKFNFDEALRCTGEAGAKLCDINMHPEQYSPLLVAQTVPRSRGLVETYWQDAGFVKLREVSASYTLPERWVRGASRASITLSGRELATWTDFTGVDPETRNQRVVPPLTRLTATFNIGF